ncbi:Dipeptidyl-peptidase III [Giardia muris]|uniref:dipeptidyl-peptidase III n=1 Tax=Giardia muris TaxID=5742 RepID=A0A4Z1SS99_GIAMU|nr:Dipeptidyl-peptidase III [Giardia muris]|eukprot:TNJ28754.1 Dipeptidyl-peptidase III [Giardia muris]
MTETVYLCPTAGPVVNLHPGQAFSKLSSEQQKYAAYLSLSAFAGAPILMDQCSPNTRRIHAFLGEYLTPFVDGKVTQEEVLVAVGADLQEALVHLHEYAGTFYFNVSEYLGLGDTKFIPRCEAAILTRICETLAQSTHKETRLLEAFMDVKEALYNLDGPVRSLGFHPDGCTQYYQPAAFSKEEVEAINKVLIEHGYMLENTHLVRHDEWYEVSLASVEVDAVGKTIGAHGSREIRITKGRNAKELAQCCKWLEKAIPHAESEGRRTMLAALIEHYRTGDCNTHKRYSELWVQDRDAVVETYQGFIENYRDPAGVRAEYEGFVACVDPEISLTLKKLVEAADKLIPKLPYPRAFERDRFIPPVYNAINVLVFLNSFSPIGINIPNYDDVRRDTGFKNVSLYNVTKQTAAMRVMRDFIPAHMQADYACLCSDALFIHVALHELFGHGTTKLLHEKDIEVGIDDPLNPGTKVSTFYKPNETFSSVFGSISNAFEECKAETTSLYLCTDALVLSIFGVQDSDFAAMRYVLVYQLFAEALTGLTLYSPERKEWLQAHAQGRFCILNACLRWSNGAVKLVEHDPGFIVEIDHNRLDDIMQATGRLLMHLGVYKSTANFRAAKSFFADLTEMTPEWLHRRDHVLQLKGPSVIYCDSMIKKVATDNYVLVDTTTSTSPTHLDVALGLFNNIRVAAQ